MSPGIAVANRTIVTTAPNAQPTAVAVVDDDFGGDDGGIGNCRDCAEGIVMGGADVVHYHGVAPGTPVPILGTAQHSVVYRNYTFWFRNASNAAVFSANPVGYIPAWGGFCAWGIAREGTNGNPSPNAERGWPWSTQHMGPPCNPHDGWHIINGTLFCSINLSYMQVCAALPVLVCA
jgi:hypothetical protein